MDKVCSICKRLLDDPKDPTTENCGGDCLRCMGEIFEDPDCIIAMLNIRIEAQADALKIARDALQEARGSLYQCFRSSRDDALESHPDWAEHIADIHSEAATALAKIDAALKESE